MPSTTPTYGLPYPLGTDRVMDGDDAIHNLGLALEIAMQGGTLSPNVVTAGSSVQVAVTFPKPFAAAPVVVIGGASSTNNIVCGAINATAAGFTAVVQRTTTTGATPVNWQAIGRAA